MTHIETDPSKVSAETHVFVGMFRPTQRQFCDRYMDSGVSPDMDGWRRGEYDIPQYVTIEEYLKGRATDA